MNHCDEPDAFAFMLSSVRVLFGYDRYIFDSEKYACMFFFLLVESLVVYHLH